MKKIFIFALFLSCFAVASFAQQATPSPEQNKPAKTNTRPAEKAAKPEPFDGASVQTMAMKCVTIDTEAGMIEIELFPEHAPESVRSFLNIVSLGYFDSTAFTRVVPGFVIQGGDLYSREGKVSYEIGMRSRKMLPDEPNKLLHERGIISMARGDEPNSAATSFFILVGNGSHLDGKFAAFGRVTKGMEIADVINKAPVAEEKPEKPVRIKKATIKPCVSPAS